LIVIRLNKLLAIPEHGKDHKDKRWDDDEDDDRLSEMGHSKRAMTPVAGPFRRVHLKVTQS
jgi:hypothetical protein